MNTQNLLYDINKTLATLKCYSLDDLNFLIKGESGEVKINQHKRSEEGIKLLWDWSQFKYPAITINNFHEKRGNPQYVFKGFDYVEKSYNNNYVNFSKEGENNNSLEIQSKPLYEDEYLIKKRLAPILKELDIKEIKGLSSTNSGLIADYDGAKQILTTTNKLWEKGSKIAGKTFTLTSSVPCDRYIYCEGIATALTIWLAYKTNINVVSCASITNLRTVFESVAINDNNIICIDTDEASLSMLHRDVNLFNQVLMIDITRLEDSLLKEIKCGNLKGFDVNDLFAISNSLDLTLKMLVKVDRETAIENLTKIFASKCEEDDGEEQLKEWMFCNRLLWIRSEEKTGPIRFVEEYNNVDFVRIGNKIYVYNHKCFTAFPISNYVESLNRRYFNKDTTKGRSIALAKEGLADFIRTIKQDMVYDGCVFSPSDNCLRQHPNYFEGCKMINQFDEKLRPVFDKDAKHELVEDFFNLINKLCNDDKDIIRWIKGWLYNIVHGLASKNYIRNETMLIMQSKYRGAGKDVLFQLFSIIIGESFYRSSKIENLIGRFNSFLQNAIFVVLQEGGLGKKEQRDIKNIVTNPRLTIESKGINHFDSLNLLNIAVTTNEELAVIASDKERRYTVNTVQDEYAIESQKIAQKLGCWMKTASSNEKSLFAKAVYKALYDVGFEEKELVSIRHESLQNEAIKQQHRIANPLKILIKEFIEDIETENYKCFTFVSLKNYIASKGLKHYKSDNYISSYLLELNYLKDEKRRRVCLVLSCILPSKEPYSQGDEASFNNISRETVYCAKGFEYENNTLIYHSKIIQGNLYVSNEK